MDGLSEITFFLPLMLIKKVILLFFTSKKFPVATSTSLMFVNFTDQAIVQNLRHFIENMIYIRYEIDSFKNHESELIVFTVKSEYVEC